MTAITASPATSAPTVRPRDAAAPADRDHRSGPSRIGALLEAMAFVGALFDPIGVLGRPALLPRPGRALALCPPGRVRVSAQRTVSVPRMPAAAWAGTRQ